MYFNIIFLCPLPAPSQAPRIIGKKFKGQSINIAWEQVEPKANEARIDGYKVSTVLFYFHTDYNLFTLH